MYPTAVTTPKETQLIINELFYNNTTVCYTAKAKAARGYGYRVIQ